MSYKFSKEDVRQGWFARLKESLSDRLQNLREDNDKDMEPAQTAKKRGQIYEIKRIQKAMNKAESEAQP
ncbi:hypothetical protein HBA55_29675 [Pseudomaricurvus alkylphenolicus]|uniref:hypothetical protein n=1 Tax=Pseudomaricurvus alkylphenolicus TaxID=1306991 RepID=UPI001422FF93|nr:hypothetical protein [Pseudomaricurvus alkylphenolicus]NIB43809.1 hypothetical protein [Pseudomaricurvus alkylphenolicus]